VSRGMMGMGEEGREEWERGKWREGKARRSIPANIPLLLAKRD